MSMDIISDLQASQKRKTLLIEHKCSLHINHMPAIRNYHKRSPPMFGYHLSHIGKKQMILVAHDIKGRDGDILTAEKPK